MFKAFREFFTGLLAEFKRFNDLYECDVNYRYRTYSNSSLQKCTDCGSPNRDAAAKKTRAEMERPDPRQWFGAKIRVNPAESIRQVKFPEQLVTSDNMEKASVDFVRRNTVDLAKKASERVDRLAKHEVGSDKCPACVEALKPNDYAVAAACDNAPPKE